jgi:hypothetical protein
MERSREVKKERWRMKSDEEGKMLFWRAKDVNCINW